jgi:hypothetical protein
MHIRICCIFVWYFHPCIPFLNLTRPGRLIRSGLDFISSSPH